MTNGPVRDDISREFTDTPAEAEAVPAEPQKPTRNELRRQLLGKRPKAERKEVTLFGVDLELMQPSLKDIMRARQTEDHAERAADMIINYACVPGTKERVFEEGDKATILEWPFGRDFLQLQEAIVELTGVDIGAAEQEIREDPLDEQS